MDRRMRGWCSIVAAVAAMFVGACGGGGAGPWKKARELRVLTRNLYLGADLTPVIGAVAGGDPDAIVLATTDAFAQVVATDFPVRAEALAGEIDAVRPDLVGLQEAALWRVQSPSDAFTMAPTPATTVAYDFVALLQAALAARGLDYVVVASVDESDVELPALDASLELQDVRFTDRDVLLARADLAARGIALANPAAGLFATYIDLGGGLVVPRGWVAVDATFAGTTVRVVSTHLEDASEDVQRAQAAELLAGPLAGAGSAILMGDLNTDAHGVAPSLTYDDLLAAGFADAWLDAGNAPGTGSTWGHDDALVDPFADLSQRLDLVMHRSTLDVTDAEVLGEDPADMFGGLWPSDHAGLFVVLHRSPPSSVAVRRPAGRPAARRRAGRRPPSPPRAGARAVAARREARRASRRARWTAPSTDPGDLRCSGAVKKLLRGIAEFRRTRPAGYVEAFARLALGQTPDALLICCADSRVAPNVFASVEPGDLLVVRNVGNLVPRYAETSAEARAGASVPAAIELALGSLHVRDVVVCGHSSCAAMRSIHARERHEDAPHLAAWLRHGEPALADLGPTPAGLAPFDHLSQRSVLLQLEHLRSYPAVREAEAAGRLRLHGWWFDIGHAEVLAYDAAERRFVPLDDARVDRMLGEPR